MTGMLAEINSSLLVAPWLFAVAAASAAVIFVGLELNRWERLNASATRARAARLTVGMTGLTLAGAIGVVVSGSSVPVIVTFSIVLAAFWGGVLFLSRAAVRVARVERGEAGAGDARRLESLAFLPVVVTLLVPYAPVSLKMIAYAATIAAWVGVAAFFGATQVRPALRKTL